MFRECPRCKGTKYEKVSRGCPECDGDDTTGRTDCECAQVYLIGEPNCPDCGDDHTEPCQPCNETGTILEFTVVTYTYDFDQRHKYLEGATSSLFEEKANTAVSDYEWPDEPDITEYDDCPDVDLPVSDNTCKARVKTYRIEGPWEAEIDITTLPDVEPFRIAVVGETTEIITDHFDPEVLEEKNRLRQMEMAANHYPGGAVAAVFTIGYLATTVGYTLETLPVVGTLGNLMFGGIALGLLYEFGVTAVDGYRDTVN